MSANRPTAPVRRRIAAITGASLLATLGVAAVSGTAAHASGTGGVGRAACGSETADVHLNVTRDGVPVTGAVQVTAASESATASNHFFTDMIRLSQEQHALLTAARQASGATADVLYQMAAAKSAPLYDAMIGTLTEGATVTHDVEARDGAATVDDVILAGTCYVGGYGDGGWVVNPVTVEHDGESVTITPDVQGVSGDRGTITLTVDF